jgi:hypothetical protein
MGTHVKILTVRCDRGGQDAPHWTAHGFVRDTVTRFEDQWDPEPVPDPASYGHRLIGAGWIQTSSWSSNPSGPGVPSSVSARFRKEWEHESQTSPPGSAEVHICGCGATEYTPLPHLNPNPDVWTAAHVCEWLTSQGRPMKLRTWHAAVSRGWAPAPFHRIGRTPLWRPRDVKHWYATRPSVVGADTPGTPQPKRGHP